MSSARIPADWEIFRLRVLLLVMWMGLALLGAALWRTQIVHGQRFEKDLDKQSVRRVRLPAIRGRILDRKGRVMAENQPRFDIVLYLEEICHSARRGNTVEAVEKVLETLSRQLQLPRELSRERILIHMRKRLPLPLTAWSNLDERAVARWAEQAAGLPGVDLVISSQRYYPLGTMAAHVLGYTGPAIIPDEEEESEERFHYYLPDTAGKSGLERVYDELLRGEAGGRMVRVDVAGFRHEDLGGRDPVAGRDLVLSLDIDTQRATEEALEAFGETPGAAVVLNPQTGEVLAMASSPGFNPNDFIPAISASNWLGLLEDARQPLFNRATAGAYAPGSTFKPITALAALSRGGIVPSTRFFCSGAFSFGRSVFRCWNHDGHGEINLLESIRYSCNVYFFQAALLTGIQPIAEMARDFGLGAKTKIDLDMETPGAVPDEVWKRARKREGWSGGDTCNVAIGQGDLLVSPLQMAVFTAALANGGIVRTPRLLMGTRRTGTEQTEPVPPLPARRVRASAAHIQLVRQGMRDVVMAPDGTGRRARIPGFEIAGKTGTAEYGKKEEGKKRGWMIAFAPVESPRFAVAVMTEDAISGGTTVAPMVQQLLTALLEAPDESSLRIEL